MRKQDKKGFFLGGYGVKKNKAQSSLEYAVVIVCLVAALLAMQIYIKRGFEGRMRQSADSIGEQYSPKNTTGSSTVSYTSNTITNVETLSEQGLRDKYCTQENPCEPCDYDLDGDCVIEDDVFGTETMTYIPSDNPSITTRIGSENVGTLEEPLFE